MTSHLKLPRLETFNESEFVRDVKKMGGGALKQNPAFNAGVPDRLCWLRTRSGAVIFFWTEWKRYGPELRPVQTAYHKKLIEAGHEVYVFHDNDDARRTLVAIAAR